MIGYALIILTFILSDVSRTGSAPTPGSYGVDSNTTLAAATLPCPLRTWRGDCSYMDDTQRLRIRAVTKAHVRSGMPECVVARAAVIAWVAKGSQAWVFERHANDDAVAGAYVLGETAVGSGAPTGFGVRAAMFDTADDITLARVALHEGAHLAGADEAEALALDSACFAAAVR